jgi:hypothetical protein
MNRKQTQTYQMLTRVVDFGTANVNLFPNNSAADGILKELGTQVENLAEAATTRVSADRDLRAGSSARDTARTKLSSVLSHAAQISNALDTNTLEMPAGRSDQALIQSAHAFALAVKPVAQDFVKHGLDPEVVATAVDELEAAIAACNTAKTKRSAAFGEWKQTLEQALGALHRLDAIARTLADNPGAMAAYETARIIDHPGGRKALKPPAVLPTTTPEVAKSTAA